MIIKQLLEQIRWSESCSSLDNWVHCHITCTFWKYFVTFTWNLPSYKLNPLFYVMHSEDWPSFQKFDEGHHIPSQSLFFKAKDTQFLQSFFIRLKFSVSLNICKSKLLSYPSIGIVCTIPLWYTQKCFSFIFIILSRNFNMEKMVVWFCNIIQETHSLHSGMFRDSVLSGTEFSANTSWGQRGERVCSHIHQTNPSLIFSYYFKN